MQVSTALITLSADAVVPRGSDQQLAARNVAAVRSTFESLSNFNREVARRAFATIKARSRTGAAACAFSTGSAPSGSTTRRQSGAEEYFA